MKALEQLGLSGAEATIYEAVLKLGTCTVKDITKTCGFHRTNIYDVLEQLKEKGLITSYQEGKAMQYQATNPQALYDFLNEKKQALDTIFPTLLNLQARSKDDVHVEVFKGAEGMKTAWRDQVREAKPIYGYGVKGQLREQLPIFAQQWLRDVQAKQIPYYGIYTENDFPAYYTAVRVLPKKYSSPVATFIYGDKVNINIWEPTLVAIVITSKLVAQMYKQHFDLLWEIAKPTQ